MAARRTKRQKKLSYFYDHEDQEAKDLAYGGQKDGCKKYLKADTTYEDGSIDGNWTPGED